MREVTIEEQRKIELQILLYVKEICDKNEIIYSLCGGTLIGAIRHKGFIPWDDDIDIFLTRENYNRLIQILKEDKKYLLQAPGFTKNYFYGFSKLADKNTIMYNTIEKIYGLSECGICIDIFPIDYIKEGKEKKIFNKIKRQLSIASLAAPHCIYSKNKWKKRGKKVLSLLYRICSNKNVEYRMQKVEATAQQYCEDKSKLRGSLYSTYGIIEIFPSEMFDEMIEVDFENCKFSAIKNYDIFLKNVYGNYMELPPVNQRVRKHESIAFWRE